MKRLNTTFLFVLISTALFAQDSTHKYALVIGNGAYTNITPLSNPVNDAYDMATALWELGFEVDMLLDAGLHKMEEAVIEFKDNLSRDRSAYGFFFYAGHGVQSGGENFLLPTDANIPTESFLRQRSVSVQSILDELNDAGNRLNIVVLDACRDNPFGWRRSGSRGLTMVGHQPADSIIVYATSAGQVASDGEGRNGLFTSQLLNNIATPGIDVNEMFRRTGAEVSELSDRQQIPAIYSQFFGVAYLGGPSDAVDTVSRARPAPLPFAPPPRETARPSTDARLWSVGASVGSALSRPWLIGTVRGTIAPWANSFLQIGLDYGMLSGDADVGYYSLYPFAHYAYYMPFERGGWYIGAGGGFMYASYEFPEGQHETNTFFVAFTAGVLLFNWLDISYALRTNFTAAKNKVSVGYTYRF